MLTDTLRKIFNRDLAKLEEELGLYLQEENLWRVEGNVANSAGNLTLHLIGNLNTYIGAKLGNSGYVRNRPEEFALKDVPRTELICKIKETIQTVDVVLSGLSREQLSSEYPEIVLDGRMSTEFFLVHLAGHLNYHLGQVNYHRRLLDY
jgi:hypothetical protein